MEEGQDPFDHREEVREMNINVENEEIEYNGHRETIELVETMRILYMEV
jgi:hypothetical protein